MLLLRLHCGHSSSMIKENITRIEIIDGDSNRIFVGYFDTAGAELSFQDNERTLKIFADGHKIPMSALNYMAG